MSEYEVTWPRVRRMHRGGACRSGAPDMSITTQVIKPKFRMIDGLRVIRNHTTNRGGLP